MKNGKLMRILLLQNTVNIEQKQYWVFYEKNWIEIPLSHRIAQTQKFWLLAQCPSFNFNYISSPPLGFPRNKVKPIEYINLTGI